MTEYGDPEYAHSIVRSLAAYAWGAGVLDSLGQFVAMPRKGMNGTLYTPRVRVRVKTSRGALLYGLKDVFGGSVGYINKVKGLMEWSVSGADGSAEIIRLVLPNMRHKARQAQLLHELCNAIMSYHGENFEDRAIPKEEIVKRERLARALQSISHL